jgi:hypothetical protein
MSPNQRASRDLEVRVDRLPNQLSPHEIDLVVEASDVDCKPKGKVIFGITLPAQIFPHVRFFCNSIEAYVTASTAAHRPQISRQTWRERNVAAHVAQLDVPLSKRYVALTRWLPYGGDGGPSGYRVERGRWVVEEALWDRQEGRLLWLALRNVYTDDVYKEGRIWGLPLNFKRYYEYQLPAVLTRRGEVRQHAPVPGSRWLPAHEIPNWASEQHAAIVLANSFYQKGDRWPARSLYVPIRTPDQAPYVSKKFEWGKESWFSHGLTPEPTASPLLDVQTHAVL